MSDSNISGVVANGLVVPSSPLPEGAFVDIRLKSNQPKAGPMSASDLRKMPREQRRAILGAAAVLAEADYRDDKELTGFVAFSEEELNDDSNAE